MIAAESINAKSSRLSGAPLKLLAICVVQLVMIVIGTLSTVHVRMCDVSTSGEHTEIECDECSKSVFDAREGLLLVGGVGVVACGMTASLKRSKRLCQVYGFIMMVYAFLISLTAILTGVAVPELQEAVDRVKDDPECKHTAQAMVDAIRDRAILYAANGILDVAGAYFAIRSKELFEYKEIEDRVRRDTALLDAGL